MTATYTTAPQPCRNSDECEGIPPGAPLHLDELGPYVNCPTCGSSQDDESDLDTPDPDAPHILPEDFAV